MGERRVRIVREPKELARPVGLYSHVSVAPSGALAFVAGQVGVDESGELAGDGGFAAQTRQAFANVGLALAEAGASFRDVCKLTTYIVGAERIPEFMETRRAVYRDLYPDGDYPPNTLLVVDRLVEERFLVEIEAIASCG